MDILEDIVEERLPDSLYPIISEKSKAIACNDKESLLVFLVGLTGYCAGEQQFAIVNGVTSSGKSHLAENIISIFFPEEDVFTMSAGSKTSLSYDKELAKKKIILFSELQKLQGDVLEIVKSLHSRDKKYTRRVTDSVTKDVIIYTIEPKAIFITYAEANLDDQLSTRCISINMPEDIKTNEEIVKYLARKRYNIVEYEPDEYLLKQIHQRIINMNKYLKHQVIIPYSDEIIKIIDTTFVRCRSDVGKLFALIAGITKYNVENRVVLKHKKNNYIISTPEDAFQVLESVGGLLDKTTSEISDPELNILSCVVESGKTISTIKTLLYDVFETNPSVTQINRNIKKLMDKGFLFKNELRKPVLYEMASELKRNDKSFNWKDVFNVGIVNVQSMFPEIIEEYKQTLKNKTIHPITGEEIDFSNKDFILDVKKEFMSVESLRRKKIQEAKSIGDKSILPETINKKIDNDNLNEFI